MEWGDLSLQRYHESCTWGLIALPFHKPMIVYQDNSSLLHQMSLRYLVSTYEGTWAVVRIKVKKVSSYVTAVERGDAPLAIS